MPNSYFETAARVLLPSSFWAPDWMAPSAWRNFAPFAFWITEAHRPRRLVELGSFWGYSYMAFCQSARGNKLEGRFHAVDTWQGDSQSGFYGEDVFTVLNDYNTKLYSDFSTLLRTTFDEAANHFPDGSIDLLHIDGFHSYEAVKHDFDTWVRKLSQRGIVLFHDTQVRGPGFGVWQFWEEVSKKYPHFEFFDGAGLGVLGVGSDLSHALSNLLAIPTDSTEADAVRRIYARLGAGPVLEATVRTSREEKKQLEDQMRAETARLDAEIARLQSELEAARGK